MMQLRYPICRLRDRRGGALIVVTFTIAVLSLVAANVLNSVSLKYAAVYQAASWQESLTGAEAGVAFGLTALRRPLLERQSAWNGWLDESTPSEFKKSYPSQGYITLAHTGDGNQAVRFRVTISAQTGAGTLNPNASRPNDPRNYYKIRAIGAAGLPGSRRLSPYKSDIALRKLNWLWDARTGGAATQPEAVRVIEAVAKPVTPFSIAIMAQEHLEIVKGSGQIVDSYNSDKGNYDPAKRRSFGNIASNGKANNMIKLENVTVHGDVAKQGGLIQLMANAKVTGQVINDFHRELKPVLSPREDAQFRPLTAWPIDAERKNITLQGSADPDNPVRYKLNTIHLHAGEKLIIKPHDPDQRSYVHIWVPGDVTIHKGGSIEIQEGVNVSFFVERNVTLEENQNTGGIRNLNAKPETLTIYGVLADDQVGAFNLKSEFKGTIFAPKHDFFVNLKAGRHIYGSLVGRRFRIEGRTQVHYDESLEDKGLTMDYALASWMEDWFDPAVRKN